MLLYPLSHDIKKKSFTSKRTFKFEFKNNFLYFKKCLHNSKDKIQLYDLQAHHNFLSARYFLLDISCKESKL